MNSTGSGSRTATLSPTTTRYPMINATTTAQTTATRPGHPCSRWELSAPLATEHAAPPRYVQPRSQTFGLSLGCISFGLKRTGGCAGGCGYGLGAHHPLPQGGILYGEA